METFIKKLLLLLLLGLPAAVHAQEPQTGLLIITNNGAITITGYRGSAPVVLIPATTNGHPVTSIGANAFLDLDIYGVGIPYGITNIGDNAFNGCSKLTNIVVPNSVFTLGADVFDNCYNLTNCTIGTNVSSIGIWAFAQCYSLTNFIIPDSVTNLGGSAFYAATNLASIRLSTNLTSIGSQTFWECYHLTNIIIPPRVTTIGDRGFTSCSSLSHVTFPQGLSSIGNYTFMYCGTLSNITFPTSFTSFGFDAFYGCSNLTSAFFQGDAPAGDSSVFTGCPNATAYYLPRTVGWDSPYGSIPAVPMGSGGANRRPQLRRANKPFRLHHRRLAQHPHCCRGLDQPDRRRLDNLANLHRHQRFNLFQRPRMDQLHPPALPFPLPVNSRRIRGDGSRAEALAKVRESNLLENRLLFLLQRTQFHGRIHVAEIIVILRLQAFLEKLRGPLLVPGQLALHAGVIKRFTHLAQDRAAQIFFCKFFEHQTEGWVGHFMLR